jgi:hypothetical protein
MGSIFLLTFPFIEQGFPETDRKGGGRSESLEAGQRFNGKASG